MRNWIKQDSPDILDDISPTLRRWGMKAWLFLGIVLAIMAFVTFFTAIAGLSVPFVVAVVLAMIFYPLVDMMERRKVSRTFGSLLVMLLIVAMIVFAGWLMWAGIYNNGEMIRTQVEAGLNALTEFAASTVPGGITEQILQKLLATVPQMLTGITSFVSAGFSSVFALIMGVYISFFLLYYLLSDWHNLSDWVGRHLGVGDELGVEITNDSAVAVRTYFYALTLANVPVAIAVGLAMWLLGLPLAIPVAIVTLITCYIPYLGAIVSAAFAVLVALGSAGVWEAAVMLIVILGMQNFIDPIITNWKASDELNMNPIVTLVSTLAGGILFGALGAVLGSPIAAVLIGVNKKFKTLGAKPSTEDAETESTTASRKEGPD